MAMILAQGGHWPIWMFLTMTWCLAALSHGVHAENGETADLYVRILSLCPQGR